MSRSRGSYATDYSLPRSIDMQIAVVGASPGHALVVYLAQRLHPPAAAVLLAPAAATLQQGITGTGGAISRLGLVCCRGAIIAALMMSSYRWRRRWRSRGACELLDNGAELVRRDDVHRRVCGVPAPPVGPRRLAAASRAAGRRLLLAAVAAALHLTALV